MKIITENVRIIWLVAFIATIIAANWAISEFGFVSVGFGLTAPAGVFFAGLAFTFRDFLHESAGRIWVVVAILVGAFLSYFIEDIEKIAIASGVAFLVSEFVDLSVYSPLRRKSWLLAVGVSNSFGLIVDSVIFLWLAFGSLQFLWGQIVGKLYMTIIAIVVIGIYKHLRK